MNILKELDELTKAQVISPESAENIRSLKNTNPALRSSRNRSQLNPIVPGTIINLSFLSPLIPNSPTTSRLLCHQPEECLCVERSTFRVQGLINWRFIASGIRFLF